MTTETVWTLGALLDWTVKHLAQKGAESPRVDAEVLLAHVVGCKRIDLYGMRHQEEASSEVRQSYREQIRKRVEGCPVAYLVGHKEFFSLKLKVSPAVLIPRPDSELAVVETLAQIKRHAQPRVLDLGAGSGNLAIAIAKHHPGAQVTAVDLSPEALAIAQENARTHGVADRVRFLQGDLFKPLALADRFDAIVSNPPYITDSEMTQLPVGVRDFEPHLALRGGPDGFAVLDRILDEARRRLEPGGALVLEIGSPQEQAARAKIAALPEYDLAPTVLDGSGHPRVLRATG